tara:strand:- start:117 stop:746 length:630 start_codon:yes stop_codon:yes gene_type:complete
MANFFSASEEEQQEILLGFWERFKYLIILAFITIILAIVGRDYFISSSQQQDLETATLYQSYLESDDKLIGEKVVNAFPDSIYADFVRLNEAKRSFQNDDSATAVELLKTIINNNADTGEFNPLHAAAKTRLAKIYLDNEQFDEVLSLMESTSELTATMLEQKADAENALGQFDKARESYMLALQNSTNQASMTLISMKISDLEGEEIE